METHTTSEMNMEKMHYKKFLVMILLSFVAMYILMYSMVDIFDNVIPNINQIYMAGLMTAPMIIIEIILMGSMYKNKKLNYAILAFGMVLLVGCFLLIRNQTTVSDKQFLKSMIPHHGAAILMVREANIIDPEIKKLAENIILSQQKEIDFMKAKLKEIEDR